MTARTKNKCARHSRLTELALKVAEPPDREHTKSAAVGIDLRAEYRKSWPTAVVWSQEAGIFRGKVHAILEEYIGQIPFLAVLSGRQNSIETSHLSLSLRLHCLRSR